MSPGMVSRRTLLRGVAGGAAAPVLSRVAVPAGLAAAACTPLRDRVQVVVVWSGAELEVFREALGHYEHAADVDLVSAGDGIGALLRSRLAAGHPPDIAVLPNPGLLVELLEKYEEDLVPLDGEIAPDEKAMWLPHLLTRDGSLFGVWLKVTHKSEFWCRDDFPRHDVDTLQDLVDELAVLAGRGRRPLSVGAADGWVLTDWFENVLLAVGPKTYRGLADGTTGWDSREAKPAVTEALCWLGRIWGIPGVFADGPARALVTQYDEATLRTFVYHQDDAAVTFGGDYTAVLLDSYREEGLIRESLASFDFPGVEGNRKPLLVGGDAAVLFRRADGQPHDKADKLTRWLASDEASKALYRGGFLTPRQAYDVFGLRWGQAQYDLSDRLGGRLARSDGQGLAGILQDFFAAVAERGDGSFDGGRRVRRAVTAALDAIIDAAGES